MLMDLGEMPDHQYVCTRIRLSLPDNSVLLPVFPYVRAYQICICQKTWASDLIYLIEKFFSFNVWLVLTVDYIQIENVLKKWNQN